MGEELLAFDDVIPNYLESDVFMFNDVKNFPKDVDPGTICIECDPYTNIGPGTVYMYDGKDYVKLSCPYSNDSKQQKMRTECPHCGASQFTLNNDYYKCDYCDSIFSYD